MRVEDRRPRSEDERLSGLVHVLQSLWTYSHTTRSDLAREFADDIAEAASTGLITTSVIPKGKVFGRLWKLTPEGIVFLFENAEALIEEENTYVNSYMES